MITFREWLESRNHYRIPTIFGPVIAGGIAGSVAGGPLGTVGGAIMGGLAGASVGATLFPGADYLYDEIHYGIFNKFIKYSYQLQQTLDAKVSLSEINVKDKVFKVLERFLEKSIITKNEMIRHQQEVIRVIHGKNVNLWEITMDLLRRAANKFRELGFCKDDEAEFGHALDYMKREQWPTSLS